ncbi:alpha/beta hydrolase [Ornithinimicrobium sufpigmenti]|uniref:alpha/beta hydrolase n=1 Tax=Ornithinimicrobium sufpigmenti TaxID=2508882 RepID=UPI001035DCE2|nr:MULTISPECIES: alpha/beta hydrolase-fold protein [unclassified Ornithinimicrobium]
MRLDLADLLPVHCPDGDDHGDLRSWRDVELPGLGRSAEIYAWLPPGYEERPDERYPVLYLHDGHNLFLRSRTFEGASWQVGQAMTRLAADGIPAIVVGIPCHPEQRSEEYTQYPHPERGGGRAADYAAFLVEHLKPAVDSVLRTLSGPEHTIVAGSSLGGVVSAYLWLEHQDVFGAAGLFSPALWWPGERALTDLEEALAAGRLSGRVHLDAGGHEQPDEPDIERAYVEDAERLVRALRGSDVHVRYVYDSTAYHFETAWADRFPAAAAWLLRGYAASAPFFAEAEQAGDG